jgi:hypothetical protein
MKKRYCYKRPFYLPQNSAEENAADAAIYFLLASMFFRGCAAVTALDYWNCTPFWFVHAAVAFLTPLIFAYVLARKRSWLTDMPPRRLRRLFFTMLVFYTYFV